MKKKKEVVSLILNILCAISFSLCSIVSNELFTKIVYMICAILWSIIIGINIANIVKD